MVFNDEFVLKLILEWEVGQRVTVEIVYVGQQLKCHEVLETMNRVVSLTQDQDVGDLCENASRHLHESDDQRDIGQRELTRILGQVPDHIDRLLDLSEQFHVQKCRSYKLCHEGLVPVHFESQGPLAMRRKNELVQS